MTCPFCLEHFLCLPPCCMGGEHTGLPIVPLPFSVTVNHVNRAPTGPKLHGVMVQLLVHLLTNLFRFHASSGK